MAVGDFHPAWVHAQSPYRLSRDREIIITGVGLTAGLVGLSLGRQIQTLTPVEISRLSKSNIPPFDRPATSQYSEGAVLLSDLLVGTAVFLPTTLYIRQQSRRDWQIITVMYLETLLHSNFIPLIAKNHIQRVRPYVYNENVPFSLKTDENAVRSFYSGHTTNAFAAAVFFSTVYGDYFPDSRWKGYFWGGSLGMASLVGYLRYKGGKHFPSDILTGAAVGSAIGFVIPYLHRSKTNKTLSLTVTSRNQNTLLLLLIQF